MNRRLSAWAIMKNIFRVEVDQDLQQGVDVLQAQQADLRLLVWNLSYTDEFEFWKLVLIFAVVIFAISPI